MYSAGISGEGEPETVLCRDSAENAEFRND